MPGFRVLLVEDDDAIVRPLTSALGREGLEVTRTVTAEDALARLSAIGPDLIVMDIGLPGMSGLDACRLIREGSAVPIIMLTARGETIDRVVGLELGADDYLPKPFSSRELIARIRAVLRRSGWARREEPQTFAIGQLEVDPTRREVHSSGRAVEVTRREFDLLAHLVARSPAVVPRDELMREVWDTHWSGSTQTLDVHVAQLRRKIEPDPRQPRYLHTVRGVGYQVRDACAAG